VDTRASLTLVSFLRLFADTGRTDRRRARRRHSLFGPVAGNRLWPADTLCAPGRIRTCGLLLRRQLWTVRGGLSAFTGVRRRAVNLRSGQRYSAAQVHGSL